MELHKEERRTLFTIRALVIFFILALVASGLTAFPLETELGILCSILNISPQLSPDNYDGLRAWIAFVNEGIVNTNKAYPFIAYGSDWLAFAHLVIAVAFAGVYVKPVRNIWIVYFGIIACVAVIPLAFICGHIRQLPFFWILIDCSFGVFGIVPLYILLTKIRKLAGIIDYKPSKY